jgi:ASC-1-like (ASCH) protein
MREKLLWIRPEYLELILDGRKTVEVRVAYKNILRLEVGDILLLNEDHRYRITRIAHYPDFKTLLAGEDPAAIAPDLPPTEVFAILRLLYPPEKEALGAVALEIERAGDAESGDED